MITEPPIAQKREPTPSPKELRPGEPANRRRNSKTEGAPHDR